MQNLEEVRRGGKHGPYPRPLRLKVVAVGTPHTYGEDKKLLNMALADESDFIKAVCFDQSKFPHFTEGSGLVLRNVIMKASELVITKQSTVFKCQAIQVHEDLEARAKNLIHPPLPAIISLSDAKKSPQKERVRIQAKVVSDGLKTTRNVKNTDVPFRTITVADQKDTIKIALWRDFANADVRPGDHVELANVVTNHYNNEIQLQTTQLTIITKIDAPQEMNEITILGLESGDVSSRVITLDGDIYTCNNVILEEHSQCGMNEMEAKFPCCVKLQHQEKNIVLIE